MEKGLPWNKILGQAGSRNQDGGSRRGFQNGIYNMTRLISLVFVGNATELAYRSVLKLFWNLKELRNNKWRHQSTKWGERRSLGTWYEEKKWTLSKLPETEQRQTEWDHVWQNHKLPHGKLYTIWKRSNMADGRWSMISCGKQIMKSLVQMVVW